MNKQDLVNKVYDHYIVRKEPFGYDTVRGGCTYMNPPCAIGIFLTDEDIIKFRDANGPDWNDEIESLVCTLYSNGFELHGPLKDFVIREENPDYHASEFEEDEQLEDEFFYAAPFLQELQRCHDNSACEMTTSSLTGSAMRMPEAAIAEFKKLLKELCNRHVLVYPGDMK